MSLLRPLRSTVVTRFLAHMGRSDSRPSRPRVMHSPRALACLRRPLRRVSQVPRLIFPHAPSPTTPESPVIALAPLLHHRLQASSRMAAWPLSVCITRPNRVRLRYGSRVRLARLRVTDCSAPRGLRYLLNGQLQGKLLSAHEISQASPGAPYIGFDVCAPTAETTSPNLNQLRLQPCLGAYLKGNLCPTRSPWYTWLPRRDNMPPLPCTIFSLWHC
jgi:hypothetical protein